MISAALEMIRAHSITPSDTAASLSPSAIQRSLILVSRNTS